MAFCLSFLTACSSKPNDRPGNGRINNSADSARTAGVADFEKVSHNFEKIKQGDEVSVRFYFTNRGEQPLLIENVTTGCGCTVAQYPRKPLKPGEKKYIEILFDTRGRKGLQYQEASVHWARNPAITRLMISAQVHEN